MFGDTQTAITPKRPASTQSSRTCSGVASGTRRVWSIIKATSARPSDWAEPGVVT